MRQTLETNLIKSTSNENIAIILQEQWNKQETLNP